MSYVFLAGCLLVYACCAALLGYLCFSGLRSLMGGQQARVAVASDGEFGEIPPDARLRWTALDDLQLSRLLRDRR